MSFSVYSRALSRAAELLGGRDKLAKALQVAVTDIEKWIADREKPPSEVFLRIVDLILDETAQAGRGEGDPAEPPPSRDAAAPSKRYLD